MLERILEMMRKEMRQTLRDKRARALLMFPPIIQLLIFGFAVNLDVENVRTAWVDMDRTAESRELRRAYDGSAHFTVTAEPSTREEVSGLLDRGRVDLVVQVERGFGLALARGETARVQLLVDGSNSNTASIVSNYARQVLARFGAGYADRQGAARLVAATAQTTESVQAVLLPTLDVRRRVWFNPDLRSRDYFVPGVIALVTTVITIILTALGIVREKEIGTMEQLMVTPLRPLEVMLGKTIPFALVGLFQVLLMTTVALVVFDVPLRGNLLLLLAAAALYLMTTLGLGLLISVVSHTQQQAMMLSFFLVFPIVLLSGFAFPVDSMPLPIQWLTAVNPMRYFVEIVRAIFLKGSGLEILWPKYVMLAMVGVLVLGVSSLRFHKRLE